MAEITTTSNKNSDASVRTISGVIMTLPVLIKGHKVNNSLLTQKTIDWAPGANDLFFDLIKAGIKISFFSNGNYNLKIIDHCLKNLKHPSGLTLTGADQIIQNRIYIGSVKDDTLNKNLLREIHEVNSTKNESSVNTVFMTCKKKNMMNGYALGFHTIFISSDEINPIIKNDEDFKQVKNFKQADEHIRSIIF